MATLPFSTLLLAIVVHHHQCHGYLIPKPQRQGMQKIFQRALTPSFIIGTSHLLALPDDETAKSEKEESSPSESTPPLSVRSRESELRNILSRFISPKIADPFLPLNDALVAQVIAPSLQIGWLALNHAPSPSWSQPIFAPSSLYALKGSLIAPTLIHGAALTTCWLLGALAARAYEKEAGEMPTTLIRVVQAGAFASGVLIMSTQVDLFWEFGRWVQLGESPEIDFRLQVAVVEMVNDIFFEALCLTSWRLFLANQQQGS